MAHDAEMMNKKNWRVSAALVLFSLFLLVQCNRFKKKEKKVSPNFRILVPLEEDYSFLKKGLLAIISLSFPSPNVVVEEGLSDIYEIPPFVDWISKADPEAILRLHVRTERPEDLPHVLAFIKRDGVNPPFKAKIASSDLEGSEFRGEALFCRMKNQGVDILERQVCRELVQAYCLKELRPQARRFTSQVPVSCNMSLFSSEKEVSKVSPKVFLSSGFPLPLRIHKADYPFTRLTEADESLLLTLFAKDARSP